MLSRAPEGSPYAELPDDDQEQAWRQLRQACKDSLYFLNKGVLGFHDLKDDLHLPLCNFLQLHTWNSPYQNSNLKVAVMPRNHFKSTNASVGKPIWFIINDPQATINLISAVEQNTIGWMDGIQKVFENNVLFRWLFEELIPTDDKWDEASKTRFVVERDTSLMPEVQPTIQATSIVSGQASKHVKHVILDDPVNEMTVGSPSLIDRAVILYHLLESTLQDFSESSIDLTATPWGFGDVIESAVEHEVAEGKMLYWKIGCYGTFECSQELMVDKMGAVRPDSVKYLPVGLSPSDMKPARITETSPVDVLRGKAEVESIFPERYPPEELARLERKYGTFMFSCNYRCDPFDPSQSGFSPSYLKYFERQVDGLLKCTCHSEHQHYLHDLHLVMCVDPAFSDKDQAAESAIVIAGIAEDGCRFLFDAWGDKVETDELWKRMAQGVKDFSPFLKDVGVEAVASQRLFRFFFEYMKKIQDFLPEEEMKNIPDIGEIVDLKPDNNIDKIRRIKAQQLFLANGQWHILHGMDKFVGQYTKFPRARPLDILDAWSYCDYMWELPRKARSLDGDSLDWNSLQREHHRRNRPYGN